MACLYPWQLFLCVFHFYLIVFNTTLSLQMFNGCSLLSRLSTTPTIVSPVSLYQTLIAAGCACSHWHVKSYEYFPGNWFPHSVNWSSDNRATGTDQLMAKYVCDLIRQCSTVSHRIIQTILLSAQQRIYWCKISNQRKCSDAIATLSRSLSALQRKFCFEK